MVALSVGARRLLVCAATLVALQCNASSFAQSLVGFAKVDITPDISLRLSGYASRNDPSVGVRDPLHVRAMVIGPEKSGLEQVDPRTVVLVSVDSILVTSKMSVATTKWADEEFGLARSQIVLSSTHSHAAPHLDGGLENLYRTPSTEAQAEATRVYTLRVQRAVQSAIRQAIKSLQPAKLIASESTATFAVNRRQIDSTGKWSGFGVQQDGLRDHRVRLLRAETVDGEILGGAYMYACHCTTLGGDFNEVSGDWAGLSASKLEQLNASSVFLPIIGCGANANPEPRGTYDNALAHSAEIVDAVNEAMRLDGVELEELPVAHFGYAALAPEHPTKAEIAKQLKAERYNDRNWAEHMQATAREMGRLPESYPMPIHTWAFGEQLTWVFLGGEVVVEYQFLIEKELASKSTWVAAYCDDVFAYVASENMLSEGGYEVDYSMYYYLQPGRWRAGTQSLILRRTSEILKGIEIQQPPLSAEQALKQLRVPEGFRVELVASEPLVQDPVNVTIGSGGVVWVVEMGDYPLGNAGGRVRRLIDENGDGVLDTGTVFLEGLDYPTSVAVHQDGVIVIAAPDILFARDIDGDGVADERRTLLTGLAESNPQHRASGFERGLDGRLHFGVGHGTKVLRDVSRNIEYDVAGRDVAWDPDTGELELTSGETQFIRARDAFGNWFGNDNSHPVFHYAVEERYQHQVRSRVKQDLMTPPVAPPVLPRSRQLARFNDLYAHRRFTSACSSIISRDRSGASLAFVCEPVHNLVARLSVDAANATFTAARHRDDTEFDFLTSTDQMFRPVRVIVAPDGSIWVVDMARSVIEHPEWIPMAWQQRIDLRAGSQLGRIFRVSRDGTPAGALPSFNGDISAALRGLTSSSRAIRDLAAQVIHESGSDVSAEVRELLSHASPEVRATALGILKQNGWLIGEDCKRALVDSDPRLVRYGIQVSEWFLLGDSHSEALRHVVQKCYASPDHGVRMQWLLSASKVGTSEWSKGISAVAFDALEDPWMLRALSLQRNPALAISGAEAILAAVDKRQEELPPAAFDQVKEVLGILLERANESRRRELVDATLARSPSADSLLTSSQLLVLCSVAGHAREWELEEIVQPSVDAALTRLAGAETPVAEKRSLLGLLGSSLVTDRRALEIVGEVLRSSLDDQELKRRAIEALRSNRLAEAGELVLSSWPNMSSLLRASAGSLLMSRNMWVQQIVIALEDGTLKPADLDLSTLERLRLHGDRELRMRSLKVLGRPNDRSKTVGEYLLKMPATPTNPSSMQAGRQLFDQHCAVCHKASQLNADAIGPPLENLKHWTNEQWATAVLSPNQAVEPKYMQTQLLTESGRVYSGIVVEQSPAQIKIAQSDGRTESVPAGDVVESRMLRSSLMPEGFETKLSPEQLAELISYLKNR
ncbi:MAG: hypothetical protein Aurels2KO_36000 [Aureliella sp.]